jgi:hypothetical protein
MSNIKTESKRIKTNSTGSMSREVTKDGVTLLYSYDTIVGYVKDGKVVLVAGNTYSKTTSQHLSKYRDEFGINPEDTFEYRAFLKRAELDGVNVLGGWNR